MRTVCFRRYISAPFFLFLFPRDACDVVYCASIRPVIKRYGDTSLLAIDFRAPSPSLLLCSLRARRNPLRQLTFRLPSLTMGFLVSSRFIGDV